MCMIKVRPEIEETPVVPARVVRHSSTRGSRRNRSRTSVHSSRSRDRSRDRGSTTVIEPFKIPPPASHSVDRTETTTMVIQGAPTTTAAHHYHNSHHGHNRHNSWGGAGSPRASVVSSRSNRDVDYYVDGGAGRSPRASSVRYVDGAGGAPGSSRGDLGRGATERYGYNNFHGRRSGSVSYVNPRHSAVSQRSARETREKVVVVDQDGNERYY